MHSGGPEFSTKFTRRAQRIGVGVAAAMAVVGMATPLAAATPGHRVDLPAGSWAVTRTADGHVRVVAGRDLNQVVRSFADGRSGDGPTLLSVQSADAVQ